MTAWQDGHYWNCFNSIRMWVSFAPRRNCSRARNNKQRPQWTPLFITAAAAWIKDVQRRFPHLTNERTHTHTWSLNNHNNKKEEREKETKGNKKKMFGKFLFHRLCDVRTPLDECAVCLCVCLRFINGIHTEADIITRRGEKKKEYYYVIICAPAGLGPDSRSM